MKLIWLKICWHDFVGVALLDWFPCIWTSQMAEALCVGFLLLLDDLAFSPEGGTLRNQPLMEKAFCLIRPQGLPCKMRGLALQGSVGRCGTCHSPQQRLGVQRRMFPCSIGEFLPGVWPSQQLLETSTPRQGKVIATAFSDSFPSWIMFQNSFISESH